MAEDVSIDKLKYLAKRLTSPFTLACPYFSEFCSIYKWDMRFLEMAKLVSTWSKDPSTKVGAVIVDDDRRVISVGYNGFARGVVDSPERLNDRELKYPLTVHAEKNAILFAHQDLRGCTLYTWPFMPCSLCAGMVIQAGIVRVVAPENDNPRWKDSFELSKQQFAEGRVPCGEFKIPVIVDLIPGLLEV